MFKILILLILIKILLINSYLTFNQWNIIKKFKQNSQTPEYITRKIDKIIFSNYYNKTTYEAYLFRKKNWKHFNYKKINYKEIESYACMGLIKAIKNYNGKYNFYNFAKIYIHSELLKSVSELTNPSILPHQYKSQYKYRNITSIYKIQYCGSDDWIFDKFSKENNVQEFNKEKMIDIVNQLNPDVRRTFYLRHGYNFDSEMPIYKVSELMCWSQETTRLKLLKAYNHIKKLY